MSGYVVKTDLQTEENWRVFQRYVQFFGPNNSDLIQRALNDFYVSNLDILETHEALRDRSGPGRCRAKAGTEQQQLIS